MNPVVLDINDENDVYTFTISNINVSYANAIRRVILSDIPTVVFRTMPYEKNDATFSINTSRLNNEILKQRLSCIPIHIDDLEMPLEDYIMEVNINNDTESIIYVTTADFRIKNIKTDKYLNDEITKKIFPPNNITKQYIDFCRLRPKISDNIVGEHLKLSSLFSIGTAKENGSFNVVSICSYRSTPDHDKIEEQLAIKVKEFEDKYEDQEEIEYAKKDWLLLDAKRIITPDSFDFKIETLGVFSNEAITKKSIKIIIARLKKIIEIYTSQNNLIRESESTIPNSYDIILENEDYTIGKILEYTLYQKYYIEEKQLTYCGFRKPHPHINESIIRVGFTNEAEKQTVVQYINSVANTAIEVYEKLLKQFGEDESLIETPEQKIPIPQQSISSKPVPVSYTFGHLKRRL